jgi:hypothetical protein
MKMVPTELMMLASDFLSLEASPLALLLLVHKQEPVQVLAEELL